MNSETPIGGQERERINHLDLFNDASVGGVSGHGFRRLIVRPRRSNDLRNTDVAAIPASFVAQLTNEVGREAQYQRRQTERAMRFGDLRGESGSAVGSGDFRAGEVGI